MENLEVQAFNLKDEGRIYLDHNATTPIAAKIVPHISDWLKAWGNPSSIHQSGRGPKALIRDARLSVASLLGVSPLEVVFTSGASEANNTVLKSVFLNPSRDPLRDTLIISSVEHPSIEKTAQDLEARFNVKVIRVPIGRQGEFDFEFYRKCISEKVALVSVMAANNETGHIFPIEEIAKLAKSVGALVHTDAVQVLGKKQIKVTDWGVDFASFSGHKFYALKGVGVLFVKRGSPFSALIVGGPQERRRRAGTENTLAIASLGLMAGYAGEISDRAQKVATLRDGLEERITQLIPGVQITGREGQRICTTSSMMIPGVDGESLLMSLDIEGISVSTGAACSSGNPEPSPVLLAMGFTRAEAQSSLRIGLGWGTTENELNTFVEKLLKTVERLRSL